MAKVPKSKVKKEVPKEEIQEEPAELDENTEPGLNLMELLNDPIAQSLLGGCKNLFKKEKPDTNTLEITIKGPSEKVLELCKIFQEK